MNMNDQRIESIIDLFVEWLDESSICCDADDIARTGEPVENFVTACRSYDSIEKDECGDYAITLIKNSQRFKGETRCDLYILDLGDVRLVYKS